LTFNEIEETRVLNYLRIYNNYLKEVPFDQSELLMSNSWDNANNLDYLIGKFVNDLLNINIGINYKEIINDAVSLLQNNYNLLIDYRQLIHSDLGPDNIIVDDNHQVVSVIDFCPCYHNELYSLSNFLYWNFFCNNHFLTKEKIKSFLNNYYSREAYEIEIIKFELLIIQTCLFRIAGPLMYSKEYSRIEKRFQILKEALKFIKNCQ
jgi:Ser/Thr protein kinase RdoA (MazF antagonist)